MESTSASDEWTYGSSFADIDAGRYLTSTASASVVRRRRWIRSVVPRRATHHPNTFHTPPPKSGGPVSSYMDGSGSEKPPSFDTATPINGNEMDEHDPATTFDGPMFPLEYDAADTEDHQHHQQHHQTESDKHSNPDPAQRRGSMFGSVFGPSSSSSSSSSSSGGGIIKVHDTGLLDLGRQIKALESEFRKWEDSQQKQWKAAAKAHLEAQIAQLEARLKLIQAKIDCESESGLGLNMEEELKSLSEQLELKKKTLFFPLSRIRLGQAGVYLGLDDLWLESASGHFVLDLIPHSETPRIHLLLSGTVFDPHAGISIRMLFQRFAVEMYVCMYVCIYLCLFLYLYICIYICLFVCM